MTLVLLSVLRPPPLSESANAGRPDKTILLSQSCVVAPELFPHIWEKYVKPGYNRMAGSCTDCCTVIPGRNTSDTFLIQIYIISFTKTLLGIQLSL